jgi:hypothetical protein
MDANFVYRSRVTFASKSKTLAALAVARAFRNSHKEKHSRLFRQSLCSFKVDKIASNHFLVHHKQLFP